MAFQGRPVREIIRDRAVVLGICAMDKKANSKPMRSILERFPKSEFRIVLFGSHTILHKPVEEWPVVDCVVCFHSSGFPLHKAEEYVRLRRPLQVNDVESQRVLLDRRTVYQVLEENNIPTPRHVVMNREGDTPSVLEEHEDFILVNGARINKPFVEKPVDADDHNVYIYYPVSAGGGSKRLFRKVGNRASSFHPGVNEVRRDASYIYEEFLPTQGTDVKVYTVGPNYAHAEARKSPVVDGVVQRDRNGKEIRYPVLLTRQEKELAWKVCIAFKQTICGLDLLRTASGSLVCDVNGFSFVKNSIKYYDDCAQLLRKILLSRLAPHLLGSMRLVAAPTLSTCLPSAAVAAMAAAAAGAAAGAVAGGIPMKVDDWEEEEEVENEDEDELRCVLAIIRHADRTPKHKLKMKVRHPQLLELFDKYGGGGVHKEIKLKSARQLKEVLKIVQQLLWLHEAEGAASDDESLAAKHRLEQVKQVLEQGGGFSGINRKVQLKPLAWAPRDRQRKQRHSGLLDAFIRHSVVAGDEISDDAAEGATDAASAPATAAAAAAAAAAAFNLHGGEGERLGEAMAGVDASAWAEEELPDEIVTEALLVLKWGGVLTNAGVLQAEDLGWRFRNSLYPGDSMGFLRLHSTFRHDLKIYASDEGRVQVTASAFVRKFLDLEGPLTPILVSLVGSGPTATKMLDDSSAAVQELHAVKQRLHELLTMDVEVDEAYLDQVAPTRNPALVAALRRLGNPRRALRQLRDSLRQLVANIRARAIQPGARALHLGQNETISAMLERWLKLIRDFCSKSDTYDLSKIPDIYDCTKYDMLHNLWLGLPSLREAFHRAKSWADVVIPLEYGITMPEKMSIATKIASNLFAKLVSDLENATQHAVHGETVTFLDPMHAAQLEIKSPDRNVRSRLYFTSESHVHSVFNLLRYWATEEEGGLVTEEAMRELESVTELDYLSHMVMRLHAKRSRTGDSTPLERYRVEIFFSPGTPLDEAFLAEADPETQEALKARKPFDKLFLAKEMQPLNLELPLDKVLALFRSIASSTGSSFPSGPGAVTPSHASSL